MIFRGFSFYRNPQSAQNIASETYARDMLVGRSTGNTVIMILVTAVIAFLLPYHREETT